MLGWNPSAIVGAQTAADSPGCMNHKRTPRTACCESNTVRHRLHSTALRHS